MRNGVDIDCAPAGTQIVVRTSHREYFLETRAAREVSISGHPEYCPHASHVIVRGSSRSGLPYLPGFIGVGMHLEFEHPTGVIIRTSIVREVLELRGK